MDKIWRAKWIIDNDFYGLTPINIFYKQLRPMPAAVHQEYLKNRHMLVRKEFGIAAEIENAFIDITADDYYKLYINGVYVGQGPAPAYYFHYNYNRYDISGFLKKGSNVIAVHVYYQGLVNRVWNSGDYRQGLIAEVNINGCIQLATDNSWKYILDKSYTSGGITGYDTQYLENIDSRFEETGWRSTGYNDRHWSNACESMADDHKLYLQVTPNLEVYSVKPAVVSAINKGHYIIDFGQEITGQFKMAAAGNVGQVIEVRCAEELFEGQGAGIRYNMRCNCIYREFWTLSGKKSDELEFYDYKAFRYVEVIGPEGVINTESFSAVVRHYPFNEDACSFVSSDELLNKIWDICKNSVKYGTQEGYLDCPSREKGQYLGDAVVTANSHIYLSGDTRLLKKAAGDFALSAFICPGLMAVAPGSYMQEIADYSLLWPMQLLLYYKHSGDICFLKEMLPVAEKMLDYFKKYEREDGLLENVTEKWNLVDWPDNLRDGYDFCLEKTSLDKGSHNVINAYYYGCSLAVNEIRSILGIPETEGLQYFKEAFVRSFYMEDIKLFKDSEFSSHASLHSNILPLLFGLSPSEAWQSIIGLVKEKRLCCGVYFAYFLMKALAAAGEYDLIYELLTSTDMHSWGNMAEEGATACFEAWGKNQKWNTSLCHPWASAPITIFIEDIAGITPYKPGWEEIRFLPQFPKSLKYASIEFNVRTGRIKVEYKDGKADIQVPEGVKVHRS